MLNYIDLFAGCGGLSEGFKKEGYNLLGAVEWQKYQTETLKNRLSKVYGLKDRALRFDIQRTEELINGWNDAEYGNENGLNALVKNAKVDLIIGGPPCQAYSVAGRIRDKNGMHDDYRNFLFESYLRVVEYYKPKIVVFENVQGMLTAKPDGISIIERIKEGFNQTGYTVLSDLKKAVFDCSNYGVPQNRKRVIIIALKNDSYLNPQEHLNEIYFKIMPKYIEEKVSVKKAIGNLPKLKPLKVPEGKGRKKSSHTHKIGQYLNHEPRFHNQRDIKIFQMLAEDKGKPENKRQYNSTSELKNLYTQVTGKTSNIHKYFVIPWEGQSNTIVAHLKKDGLRHIHPDPDQGRSITVREAARLQTFPDNYEFLGPKGYQYEMIGNAVPPKFSNVLAKVIKEFLGK